MRPIVPRIHRSYDHWLRALYCLYAGLFAFVLPLICWGAQATPGHPHARAHFVFVAPPLHTNTALATTVDADTVTGNGEPHNLSGSDHAGHHPAKKPVQKPVGRSVPSTLGFALLLLIGLSHSPPPLDTERPNFCCWVALPTVATFIPLVPTPPPR